MLLDRVSQTGAYAFYDFGAYGLFTLKSERFQPTHSARISYPEVFARERAQRPAIDPTQTLIWKELGGAIKALGGPVTVLDVGAYIGTVCMPLALAAKAEGVDLTIRCFEPSITHDLLAINIDFNNLHDTITLERAAISSFDGYTVFRFDPGGAIGGRAYGTSGSETIERIVPVRTLDSVTANISGKMVIKLDTQGHEHHIMGNSLRFIAEKRAIWQIEFLAWSGRAKVGEQTFVKFLLQHFHVFEGRRRIVNKIVEDFLNEVDARKSRMADLLLVPRDAPFTDAVLAAIRP
jgi:FkbM family methyltransferase